jgi:hypothetical protein
MQYHALQVIFHIVGKHLVPSGEGQQYGASQDEVPNAQSMALLKSTVTVAGNRHGLGQKTQPATNRNLMVVLVTL